MPKNNFILKTKLIPPQTKETILLRERPLSLIEKNLDRKLILICADAGYGKTTLLAQLCAKLNKSYIFYALEPLDNDLATFFSYIIYGFEQRCSSFARDIKNIANQTRNIEILVGTFINEFVEKIKRDFYIILDDYHHLQKNKEIAKALDYLLHHQPANLHLVIASRSTPPLNLAFYFAKQELFKIEKKQLKFKLDEIQSLLKEIYRLKIPNKEVARIEQHSEGWITAIQLILQKISASGEDKAKETLNGYIASGEEIFNYFAREVFESQPKQIQNFLIKTALLEIITPEICREILRVEGAKTLLNYLKTEHIFIDEIGHLTYKYHPLFKEFLLENFKEEFGIKELRVMSKKIGQYYKIKENSFLAIEYFLKANEFNKAARIIKSVSTDLISKGELSILNAWLESIPETILKKYPDLIFAKGKISQLWGKLDEALKYLEQADELLKLKKKSKERVPVLIEKGTILTIRGDLNNALKTMRLASRLLPKYRKPIYLNYKVKVLVAAILQAMGKLYEAQKYIYQVWQVSRKHLSDSNFAHIASWAAFIYSRMGEEQISLETLEEIIENYKAYSYSLYWMGTIYANAASSAAEVGDTSKAETYLTEAQELCTKFNDNITLAHLFGIKGNLYLEKKKFNKAKECYKKILKLNREIKEWNLEFDARIDLSTVYLSMGNVEKAKKLCAEAGSLIDLKTLNVESIQLKIQEGNIFRITRDWQKALKNYRKALSIAQKINAAYEEVKIWYKITKLHIDKDKEINAVKALKNCLDLAQKRGLHTGLVKEGRKDLSIFEFLLKRKINYEYTLSILKQIGTEAALKLLRDYTEQPRFKICLFGELEISDSKNKKIVIPWRTQKAKSLFCFFIANPTKKVIKDYLIEQFWPNKNLSQAEQSLYTNIYYLRKFLKRVIGYNIISHKQSYYFLNPQFNFISDITKFEELIKETYKKESSEQRISYFEEAIALYKNDLLLELYDTWVSEMREYFTKQYLDILKKTGLYYFRKNNYSQGLKFFTKAITKNHFDEESYQNAMICYINLGNPKAAIDLYNNLKKLFKQELKVEPNIRTIEIYQNLVK